jgi:hypothetical protein
MLKETPMVFIPITMDHKEKVRGLQLKEAHCEMCNADYVFTIQRVGAGRGTSLIFMGWGAARQRARARAEEQLRKILAKETDGVPCPVCGWHQRDMIRVVRRQRLRWMKYLALWLLALLPFLSLATLVTYSNYEGKPLPAWYGALKMANVIVAAACPTLLIGRAVSNWFFDPNNADHDQRIELGRARAKLKAEYLATLRAPSALI